MSEYIDKNSLIGFLLNKKYSDASSSIDYGEVIQIVNSQPAADVQKVVRCKDCFFYEEIEYYPNGVKRVCELLKRVTQENDFCTYGVKKNKERKNG